MRVKELPDHFALRRHFKGSANTIRPIDGRLVDKYPMFKKGHILVSMREIHTIAIVDPEQEKVTWALTGMWRYQHEPRLLENGNLLLFDNRGVTMESRERLNLIP